MSREEEGRLLDRYERELPGLRAKLSQAQANIRGKEGKAKTDAQKKAFTLAQEVGGMVNTIKALKSRLGRK